MGTNFYTLDGTHIGKRWAAGTWCWDCRVAALPLVADNLGGDPIAYTQEEMTFVLRSISADNPYPKVLGWRCPCCGATRMKDDDSGGYNPATVELGFQKALAADRPHGVAGASGWIWQIGSYGLADDVAGVEAALKRRRTVCDEYGTRYTRAEFAQVLARCIRIEISDWEFS